MKQNKAEKTLDTTLKTMSPEKRKKLMKITLTSLGLAVVLALTALLLFSCNNEIDYAATQPDPDWEEVLSGNAWRYESGSLEGSSLPEALKKISTLRFFSKVNGKWTGRITTTDDSIEEVTATLEKNSGTLTTGRYEAAFVMGRQNDRYQIKITNKDGQSLYLSSDR